MVAMDVPLAFALASSPIPLAPSAALSQHMQNNKIPRRYTQAPWECQHIGMRIDGPGSLRAKLGVCTEQDCIQQGAYQTLAGLKKVAKGRGVKVDSCPCLGMCGLGPCVSIDWTGTRAESRGGIDALDKKVLRKLVQDAANPPPPQAVIEERDPYAEQ